MQKEASMDNRKLLNDFFEQDSLTKLAKDSSAILGCPLMIVDETFHIVAHSMPAGFDDKVFVNAISRGEITYEAIATISNSDEILSGQPAFVKLDDSPIMRRFSRLSASGILLGYLICVDLNGMLRDFPAEDFAIIEAVLAKQLFFELNRVDSAFETAEEILEHLLDGGFSSEAYFKIQASSTYLADFKPRALAVVDLKGYHNLYLGSNQLKEELTYNFYASHPFMYKGDILLFLHEGYDIDKFKELANEFHLKVIISNKIESLFLLPELYKSACEAMDILIDASPSDEGLVFRVSELSPLILLSILEDRHDLINPHIQRLADYDKEKDGDYCETLFNYLISGNSLKKTCEAMFTHRNTVLYRIHKMKEEFDIPLDNADAHTYLLLSLSLVLYEEHGPNFFLPQLG